MKIAILTPYYVPVIGGLIYNVQTIAKKLSERGHEVKVITCLTEESLSREMDESIDVYRIPCWHLLDKTFPVPKPSQTIAVLKDIRQWHPDIVSTQTRFFITTLVGWMFGKCTGTPVVHTERGSRHSVVTNPVINIISQIYDHFIGYVVTRWSSACTAVSQQAGLFVKHLGGRQAIIIPNGIDMGMFPECAIKDNQNIIFVGRIIQAKGVQDLIKAMSFIVQRYPEVRLTIVGGGPYLNELKKLAADCKVGQYIEFTGPLSREDTLKRMQESAIFVNPSYSEGLPTSVMEASAAGLPVLATDVGGTTEIVDNFKTGMIIEPGEYKQIRIGLETLLYDNDLVNGMGENGRRKMEREYNWDGIISNYEKVFQQAFFR